MNVNRMLEELRESHQQLGQIILLMEQFVASGPRRRGRPPAWMSELKPRRGRPPGSKNKPKDAEAA